MNLKEALLVIDLDPDDPRIDEAIEYAGQIPENVRHMRASVARMLVRWSLDNGGNDGDG